MSRFSNLQPGEAPPLPMATKAGMAAADAVLQAELDTEAATRAAADTSEATARAAASAAEATTRASADTTLQTNITAEATARASADFAEATARVNADTALQTDINTRATSVALTAHTGASSGAHAASAISNTPAGNLAASTVQAALDELQTDVDTRALATNNPWTVSGSNAYTASNIAVGQSANPANKLEVVSTVTTSARGARVRQTNSGVEPANLSLAKSRGSLAVPAIVVSGDYLGMVGANGWDGAAYQPSGGVGFLTDGTVSAGNVPTAVVFHTTATVGSGSGATQQGSERMRIASGGKVGIGVTNPGQLLSVAGAVESTTGGFKYPSGAVVLNHITGTATWDPDNLLPNRYDTTTVTVTGAAVGDVVSVGFSTAVPAGVLLIPAVTAANTVTVTLLNLTAAAVNLASGTLRASVWQY